MFSWITEPKKEEFAPPKIVKKPDEVTADEQERATILCTITGNPRPEGKV